MISRRKLQIAGGAALLGIGGLALAVRRKLVGKLSALTTLAEFDATPPLVPHDPATDRVKIQWPSTPGVCAT